MFVSNVIASKHTFNIHTFRLFKLKYKGVGFVDFNGMWWPCSVLSGIKNCCPSQATLVIFATFLWSPVEHSILISQSHSIKDLLWRSRIGSVNLEGNYKLIEGNMSQSVKCLKIKRIRVFGVILKSQSENCSSSPPYLYIKKQVTSKINKVNDKNNSKSSKTPCKACKLINLPK